MTFLGRVVAQRYRMLYPLGHGGMGAVWVAEHLELKSPVAVKFIDPALAEDERAKQRFRLEAQAAASLRSPHVVQVFDYGIDDGEPFIVMEVLEGDTLAGRLARTGQLTLRETARLSKQITKALAMAHAQGIVHRDLKPANVFLVGDEAGFIVKLLDFGVAKIIRRDRRWSEVVTQPGNRLGTLNYMSPEQLRGDRVDARADVWSLAIMVFECLTGRLPFPGLRGPKLISVLNSQPLPRPSAVANVPAGFDEWFARATSREVELRESSVEALDERFQKLVQGREDGICEVLEPATGALPSVIAFHSSSGSGGRDTSPGIFSDELLDEISDSASALQTASDRTSIPAAINGLRDLDHVAVIARMSRQRGVLWTRHLVKVGEEIQLTILLGEQETDHTTTARVERVDVTGGDRPELWPYAVTVRFAEPLPSEAT